MGELIAIAVGFLLLVVLGYIEYKQNYKRDHSSIVKKIPVEGKK